MADCVATPRVQLLTDSSESSQNHEGIGASPVSSPVGSSLLRVRRARAFATARLEMRSATLEPTEPKTDDFSSLKTLGLCTLTISGLSQTELDSLCVVKNSMPENVAHPHVNIMQEGLDQASLDAMSVQDLGESSTEGVDELLLRIRRCGAFQGLKAAAMLAENEAAQFQHSSSLEGISQSSLDMMCKTEDSASPEATDSPDSALLRMRRIRAYLGPDKAEIAAAAEQHQLCSSLPGGLSQATLDELCSDGDDGNGSESNSECSEPNSSMLLRIRRARAFLGREQHLVPEDVVGEAEPRSVRVLSPSMARDAWGREDTNISTMLEATSTTCSTRSSFCEGNDVDVTATGSKIHMPTRKMRVVRGGA